MVALRSQVTLLAAAALVSCDRQRTGDAFADTARPGVPDTLVRRVVRVNREASAMQRVTGVLGAVRALRPLDSALAVRVMDARGRELSGVPVSWTLRNAGDGAQLRVINARTDSLGVSRVAFTPGRTAIPQTVVAEVASVGIISFPVSVLVASIRLHAERRTLWSDAEESVGAELRDAAGTILSGGPLVWRTTDSTVLAIMSSDVIQARVRGRLAGAADVVAWVEPGTVRGSTRLTVRPVVTGAFVALDGKAVPEMRLEIRAGAVRDSVAVVNARFDKRIELPPHTSVELQATPPAGTPFHPVHLRVTTPRALQNMTIALVPTSWRIEGGTHDGREIPIDAARALRRLGGNAAFWRLAPLAGNEPTKLVGWPESELPLRIAFNRGRSTERIATEDSVAFWRIAEQMERDLGLRLFAPAEPQGDSIPAAVVAVEIGTGAGEGHTFVTWNQSGDAYDGVLMFRRASTLRNAHVVTHELLHLLGFGHATSFPSVSQAVSGTEPRMTPEDVAYAQLAMRLRRLQSQNGALPGLPVANQ